MAWYKTGTIAINGKEVTGSGTKWADPSAGIGEGQALLVPSSGVVKIYEIARVNGDTSMTLVSDASNLPSGSAYAILSFYGQSRPDFARQLAATLRSYQEQSDALKQFYSATGDITVEIDGVQYTGSSFQKITTELDKKADKTYVDTELDKKADKTYVDTELDKKADKTYVDNTIAGLTAVSLFDIKVLTTTSAYSAPENLKYCIVKMCGGGGSGSSQTSVTLGAGGGGGAGTVEAKIPASLLTGPVTVTIGAGGASVTGYTDGLTGGDSYFGNLITAYGGGSGYREGDSVTPRGGIIYNSAIRGVITPGQCGQHASQNTVNQRGGSGGSSLLGFGGAGGYGSTAKPGSGYGGGGGGTGGTSSGASGAGSNGVCIIYEYC
ncbi:putative tail protein [Edwardsiella phage eiAU-183]|uniref:Putative tail protein n=2 Tax=Eiauvirus eiAU TaxID=1982112 RepID=W0LHS3_9CAUD|nr:putative tail protein [Edwardsiella phage eiAU-183]YP_009613857.1 putative tail protein [Edwardsiella phage eiAU]AHG23423.1 putative tail protein [Edwardsiella phage eiAU]AHG23477.1 putative tail protein [Edwardsiella phage eiAU-183]